MIFGTLYDPSLPAAISDVESYGVVVDEVREKGRTMR